MDSQISSTSFARPATMTWRARANSEARATGTQPRSWAIPAGGGPPSRVQSGAGSRQELSLWAARSIRCHCSGSTRICLLMDCSVESAIAFFPSGRELVAAVAARVPGAGL